MSNEEPPLIPADVEARFRDLASVVPDEDWQKLVAGTTDAILKRIGAADAFGEVSPAAMEKAYQLIGAVLVDYTNVALTCVATGLAMREAQQK